MLRSIQTQEKENKRLVALVCKSQLKEKEIPKYESKVQQLTD